MGAIQQILFGTSAAGGGFSPSDIAGLSVWFDPSDSSTLFDSDVGGSTPADGGAIGRIEDKSGNANHAKQATAGNRPLYRVSGINSLGAMDFISSDFFNMTSTVALTHFTLFFAFTRASAGKKSLSFGSSTSYYPLLWYTDNKLYSAPDSFTGFFSSAADTSTGNFIVTVTRNNTTPSGEIWLNGVSKATGSPFAGTTEYDYLGRRSSDYHDDEMGEVIIYNSVLSAGDRADVEDYLTAKWVT